MRGYTLMLTPLALEMAHQLIAERLAEAARDVRATQVKRETQQPQTCEPRRERWIPVWSWR
jgi:hypothetical protein